MEKLQIRASVPRFQKHIDIDIFSNTHVAVNMEMKEIHDHEYHEPVMRISKTMAQVLMDDLWNTGIRPTEGMGSAGSFAAQEKHLNDMRKIASSQLEIEL